MRLHGSSAARDALPLLRSPSASGSPRKNTAAYAAAPRTGSIRNANADDAGREDALVFLGFGVASPCPPPACRLDACREKPTSTSLVLLSASDSEASVALFSVVVVRGRGFGRGRLTAHA